MNNKEIRVASAHAAKRNGRFWHVVFAGRRLGHLDVFDAMKCNRAGGGSLTVAIHADVHPPTAASLPVAMTGLRGPLQTLHLDAKADV